MNDNMSILEEKSIEVIDDEVFNYDGYQVVRGEFFAHTYEPTFVFHRNTIFVNAACLKKLPETDYIQILVNPEKKQLAVLPCDESDKDSFKWSAGISKRSPRHITCPIFSAKVRALMDWTPDFKYKLLGKLLDSGNQTVFVFDLKTPEIFVPKDKDGKSMSRKANYPEEWQNQFGLPVSAHQNKLEISVFNGHAVFRVEDDNHKEAKNGEQNSSGETEYLHRSEEEQNKNSQGNVASNGGPSLYPVACEPEHKGYDYSSL